MNTKALLNLVLSVSVLVLLDGCGRSTLKVASRKTVSTDPTTLDVPLTPTPNPTSIPAANNGGNNSPVAPPPQLPTGFTLSFSAATTIQMRWNAQQDASGFVIERSLDGANFGPLISVPASITTYQDAGLAPGQTYFYRAFAFNAVGMSPRTAPQSASVPLPPAPPPPPPPPAIDSFTASPQSIAYGGTSTLTWAARNVANCILGPGGNVVEPAGTQPLTYTSTVTHTLTCGSASATLTVTVAPPDCNSDAAVAAAGQTTDEYTHRGSNFVNRYEALRAGGKNIPAYWNPWYGPGDGINLRTDVGSATAACNLMGYRSGTTINVGRWSSPGDNATVEYLPGTKTFAVRQRGTGGGSKEYAYIIRCTGKLIDYCYNNVGWVIN